MRTDIKFAHKLLQHDPVGIAMRFQYVRMGCTQNNIDHIRGFFNDSWKRLQYIFNALIRGKQAKCEQHLFAFHAELVFVVAGINKRRIRNAVMDKDNFVLGNVIDIFEQLICFVAHHDQSVGQIG